MDKRTGKKKKAKKPDVKEPAAANQPLPFIPAKKKSPGK
jgi:hypothetical protein